MISRFLLWGACAAVISLSACVERDLPEDNAYAPSPPPRSNSYSSTTGGDSTYSQTPASSYGSSSYGSSGRTVTVRQQQTLYGVARQNGVSVHALIDANNLQPPYGVHAGEVLRLPSGSASGSPSAGVRSSAAAFGPPPPIPARTAVSPVTAVATPLPTRTIETAPIAAPIDPPDPGSSRRSDAPSDSSADIETSPAEKPLPPLSKAGTPLPPPLTDAAPQPSSAPDPSSMPSSAPSDQVAAVPDPHKPPSDTRFYWPVRGQIISGFSGKSGSAHNDGVNIAAPEGTVVNAADSGTVAFVGEKPGFGNLLLIKHDDGWISAYAHNQVVLVTKGQRVRRGQPVARVGSTGGVTQPQLHFELRQGVKAVDPLDHMPQLTSTAG